MKKLMGVLALMFVSVQVASAATLTIGPKGQEMAFDKTELTVKAGEEVKLTFNNTSALPHNWVLVKPGMADKVGTDSLQAGEAKNWVAEGPNVLAHTKLVQPKQKDTVTFKAPAQPGSYPYICTFPGHYMMMKGVLKVVK